MYYQLIQPTLWLLVLAVVTYFVVQSIKSKRLADQYAHDDSDSWDAEVLHSMQSDVSRYRRRAVLAGVIGLLVVPAIGVVPPGYRGVVYEWTGGIKSGERAEGVTFLVPWVQHLNIISVRTQKYYSDEVFSQSSDLQEVTVVASVNFHVDPTRAAELYRDVDPDYQSAIVQPAMYHSIKAAVGQVAAESFAENREILASAIEQQLEARLANYGIVMEYVNIEDAIFDPDFIRAVKDKVIAEQKVEEQRRLIAEARAIKQQEILKAEARAAAIRIEAHAQAEANRDIRATLTADMLSWQWLRTWDGVLPTTLVGGNDQLTFLLGPQHPVVED